MNRRQLLRTGSLGSLGLLASNTFPTALGQARTAGANERIRVGIVGFSERLTGALLPAFRAFADEFNCEIVGVSDIWSRRREDAQKWFTKNTGKSIETYRNNEELYERPSPTPSSFPLRTSNIRCI